MTGALWEHVPRSNFSQRISRVQLGESQVELGTQIPLGNEHLQCLEDSRCESQATVCQRKINYIYYYINKRYVINVQSNADS